MRKLTMPELGRKSIEGFKTAEKMPVVVVMDNVRSALNVGSVFRTCDAFAIDRIVLCGITAQPPNKEMMKTALGSTESVAWAYFSETTEALQQLQSEGYELWAVEQVAGSLLLSECVFEAEKKYALIFGNEVEGVSNEALQRVSGAIEIPQFGTKHSLNVAVSAGIVLWEAVRQLKNV